MPGKKREITPKMKAALELVRANARELDDARRELESRIREEYRRQTTLLEAELAFAVRRARDAHATMAMIGEQMGTKDYTAVRRWLDRTENMPSAAGADAEVAEDQARFKWVDREAGIVAVAYPYFTPIKTVADRDSMPEVLEGTAQLDSSTLSGWSALSDPGTVQGKYGKDMLGHFTLELEQVPADYAGGLPALLNEWAGR